MGELVAQAFAWSGVALIAYCVWRMLVNFAQSDDHEGKMKLALGFGLFLFFVVASAVLQS